MKQESPKLAAFQDILLEVLLNNSEPKKIRQELLNHPDSIKFIDYINDMDDKMIATASQLLQKWHS